jgi:hypothetical protein
MAIAPLRLIAYQIELQLARAERKKCRFFEVLDNLVGVIFVKVILQGIRLLSHGPIATDRIFDSRLCFCSFRCGSLGRRFCATLSVALG